MLNRLISIALFSSIGLPCVVSYGQDAYYSQPYSAPIYYNPAHTGFYKGLRARMAYRSQWPQYYDDIKNYYFSMDLAERAVPGLGGAGMIISSNQAGSGSVKTTSFGLAAASRIKLSRFITTQLGFTGLFTQKEISDVQDYIFSDQLDHRHGLIYDLSSFSNFSETSTSYPDLVLGGIMNYLRKNISATVGFSVHHLFRPDESFLGLETRLPRKYVGEANLVIAQKRNMKNGFIFNPSVYYEYQNGFSTYYVGMNAAKSALRAGVWYRNRMSEIYNIQALTIMAGVKLPITEEDSRLYVSYSYDLDLGELNATGGAHEIHLNFEFDNIKILKKESVFREDYDYPVINKVLRF